MSNDVSAREIAIKYKELVKCAASTKQTLEESNEYLSQALNLAHEHSDLLINALLAAPTEEDVKKAEKEAWMGCAKRRIKFWTTSMQDQEEKEFEAWKQREEWNAKISRGLDYDTHRMTDTMFNMEEEEQNGNIRCTE